MERNDRKDIIYISNPDTEGECIVCGRPLMPWEDDICDDCVEEPFEE